MSAITVGYNGPEYSNVDKFVAKFIEGKNVPSLDQWQPFVGMESMKVLRCSDFEIQIFAGGSGGSLNYVSMKDIAADDRLKERRKKAREMASPTPKQ